MGKLFCSENIISFFELIHRPVASLEELRLTVGQAIACVAQELHIGKITVKLSEELCKLGEQTDDYVSVLYHGEEAVSGEEVTLSSKICESGKAVLNFYVTEGYRWNEDELGEIRIIGKQIFTAFSQLMMNVLLKNAKISDLSVGIPNISGFMEFVERMFAQEKLEQYDVIYLNIHNFNYVNKMLPHEQADEVMKIYADMLVKILDKNEIVARLGGDNFIALVRRENAEKFIQYISSINIIYEYEDQVITFNFGATIGAANLNDLKNVGEVTLRAGIAYQVARQRKYNGVLYYNDEICKEIMHQNEMIAEFHQALMEQEFLVYYQPKVALADKRICGAEALVRWKRKGGIIKPAQFIPILEKNGSVCKLDFYVLDKVCALLDKCRKDGVPLTKISVNFSRKHVENPNLVNEIVAVIDKYNVPHKYLEIELTESEEYRDYNVISKIVNDLKEENISTSIDDFGTGYSSLSMLKMTNVDLLKIDKSIVPLEENCTDEEKDLIMYENIAHLAKDLGIKIVAEGVETKQQFDYLYEKGCDMIQGFLFDKALPEEKFLERISIGHY